MGPITIQAFIDARLFSEFAWFDLLHVQKQWRRPALFAAFFAAIAAVAFSRAGSVEHAALLGVVLLAVGIGLPLVYFGGFFLSVRRQGAAYTGQAAAYTLSLDAHGVSVFKGKQSLHCEWGRVYAVHRLTRCICIYTEPRRAFLLPSADNSRAVQDAWKLMTAKLEPAQIFDHRAQRSAS